MSAMCTRCKARPIHRRWDDGTGLCDQCYAMDATKPTKGEAAKPLPAAPPIVHRPAGDERAHATSEQLGESLDRAREYVGQVLNSDKGKTTMGRGKRLDDATVEKIRELWRESALRTKEIAEKFGTTEATVYAKCSGIPRKNPPKVNRGPGAARPSKHGANPSAKPLRVNPGKQDSGLDGVRGLLVAEKQRLLQAEKQIEAELGKIEKALAALQ